MQWEVSAAAAFWRETFHFPCMFKTFSGRVGSRSHKWWWWVVGGGGVGWGAGFPLMLFALLAGWRRGGSGRQANPLPQPVCSSH